MKQIISAIVIVAAILSLHSCSLNKQNNAASEVIFCKDDYTPEIQYGLSGYNVVHTGIEIFGFGMDPLDNFNCLLKQDGTLSVYSRGSDSQFEKRQKYEKKIKQKISNGDYGTELQEWYNSLISGNGDGGRSGFWQFGFIRLSDAAIVIVQYMKETVTENYLLKVDPDLNELYSCRKFDYPNKSQPINSTLLAIYEGYICVQNLVWFDGDLAELDEAPCRIPDVKEEKSNLERLLLSNGYDSISDSVDEQLSSFFFKKIGNVYCYSFLAAKPENGDGFDRYFCEFSAEGELLRLIRCSNSGAQSVAFLSSKSTPNNWFEI